METERMYAIRLFVFEMKMKTAQCIRHIIQCITIRTGKNPTEIKLSANNCVHGINKACHQKEMHLNYNPLNVIIVFRSPKLLNWISKQVHSIESLPLEMIKTVWGFFFRSTARTLFHFISSFLAFCTRFT